MKRSDMISKIQDLLENANVYNPRVAREVLRLVEDEGMEPPAYYTKYDSNGEYITNPQYWEMMVGEWEDE